MTRPDRPTARRRLATVAVALAATALVTACSIASEERPRTITRETTVAPTTIAP